MGAKIRGFGNVLVLANNELLITETKSWNPVALASLIRLNSDDSLDSTFNPGTGPDSWVTTITPQADSKIILGGNFLNYNGTATSRLVRILDTGAIDSSFNIGTGFNGAVTASAIQSDGKIIVAGNFSQFNGSLRGGLVRLNADGSLDNTYTTGTGFDGTGGLEVIFPLGNGQVLVGGDFNSFNGTNRAYLIKLNTDGSLDTSFNIDDANLGEILAIQVDRNNKIYIGGHFFDVNGDFHLLTRLNPDGSTDNSFSPFYTPHSFMDMILLSDGKILLSQFGGPDLNKLNTDGTRDTTFSESFVSKYAGENDFNTLSEKSDGTILIGGSTFRLSGRNTGSIIHIGW